jgi:hypothetical protein
MKRLLEFLLSPDATDVSVKRRQQHLHRSRNTRSRGTPIAMPVLEVD